MLQNLNYPLKIFICEIPFLLKNHLYNAKKSQLDNIITISSDVITSKCKIQKNAINQRKNKCITALQ